MEWIRGPTIGRGSTATVSLATAAPSGALFAVKSAELSRSAPLRRERLVLSKLASPHVVQYLGHDVTRESGKLYYNLWTEYLPKGTLFDEIRRRGGSLDEPEIRSHARKILRGLEYLHENGLVHGDVKSQNLLMGSDGLKVADLGCARFVEPRPSSRMLSPSQAFSGVDSRKTHDACGEDGVPSEHTTISSDVFSGTPMFMAPEVARNEEQSFPSDVWSVGCTVIEMATGKGPWAESDPVSVLYRIGFSGDAPEIPRQLSDSGKDFLAKCLARDPRERCSVKELLGHPFLDESKTSEEFTRGSPSGVLDSGFWDSVDVWESPRDQNGSGVVDSRSCSQSPATERMRRLIEECESSSANRSSPDGASDGEWITVRSDHQKEEVREIPRPMDNDAPPLADSISYEEELQSSLRDDNSHQSNNTLDDYTIAGSVVFKVDSFVDSEDDFRDNNHVKRDLTYEAETEITDSLELQVLYLNSRAPFPADLLTSPRVLFPTKYTCLKVSLSPSCPIDTNAVDFFASAISSKRLRIAETGS
ncbi:hypothetical protein BT93_F2910 [Corymbia citriodora subsp. variegata]|nr:hypothetical protein BT93_F2910 [Corymbia citriodora subsp. variegata]